MFAVPSFRRRPRRRLPGGNGDDRGRRDAQYAKADALALHFQARSDRLFVFFSVTTLVMGLAYLAYEKFVESRLLLFAYVIVLLSGFGLYFLLHERHWFAKHLMHRALAETLRAKFIEGQRPTLPGAHESRLGAFRGMPDGVAR